MSNPPRDTDGKRGRRAAFLVAALAAATVLAVLLAHFLSVDPRIPLLVDEGSARWIRPDIPFDFDGQTGTRIVLFRKSFRITAPPARAFLRLRSFRDAEVRLDGNLLLPLSKRPEDWKKERTVDLAPHLFTGDHEIEIRAVNNNGPCLVIASCREAGLFTSKDWDARLEGKEPLPVLTADETPLPPVLRNFQRAGPLFTAAIPFLLPAALAAIGAIVFFRRRYGTASGPLASPLAAERVRLFLLAGWTLLMANNILKIIPNLGYDGMAHFDYVEFVSRNWRIPSPSQGIEMWHPPLFYFIAALSYKGFGLVVEPVVSAKLLRWIPMLCGLFQIEIAYRTLRVLFPLDGRRQILGTLVAGLMPVNIYISQGISNEPLAALLSAAAILACIRFVHREDEAKPRERIELAAIGLMTGLALLTKVSAFLLLPPAVLMAAYGLQKRVRGASGVASGLGVLLGTVFVVSGWYYLLNLLLFGKIFVGNWDPASGFAWWQDPGFRTLSHLSTFGESLSSSVFSGLYSFWDSMYATFWMDNHMSGLLPPAMPHLRYTPPPPWNYRLMLSGLWLGVIPTAAILAGAVAALSGLRSRIGPALLLSVSLPAMFLLALFWQFVTVPYYCSAKASYLLGLLPCFAVLTAEGVGCLPEGTVADAILYVLFSLWAIAAYGAYFVL